MQRVILLVALLSSTAVAINPLSSVISLLEDLHAKVSADMAAEAKAYAEYAEYCKTTTTNLGFEIKTSTMAEGKLKASIAQSISTIEVATSKIDGVTSSIAAAEAELKDATAVRAKETEDFKADEKELLETIGTIERAIAILSREMARNPASFAQISTNSMAGLLQAVSVMVDAAALSSKDQSRLVALVQAQQNEDSDDDEPGAPAVAAYKSHSSNIVEVLEDLKDKAEAELASLRKAEMNAKHSFELLKQSLEDQVAADKSELSEEKTILAGAAEEKASAEGELAVTVKDLADTKADLETTKSTCASKAEDHAESVTGFETGLKVLAEATTVLKEMTSGAVEQTYSFLQVQADSKLRTRADLANHEVVALVRKVAREQHSTVLQQLASRIAAVIRYGQRNGEDPFAKVKGLITDLIEKLMKEAGADATEKAYCDKEMKTTATKKAELSDAIAQLSVKIDKAEASSTQLKEDVSKLQEELAALAKRKSEMDEIRATEKADYDKAKADLTLGLEGVHKAMAVLKEYYGSPALLQQPAVPIYEKAADTGKSIIDILEQVEADFSKDLADKEAVEADAVQVYEKETQEMKITVATKDKDVEYKTGEFTALDKTIAELSSDKETTESEQAAVLEYDEKIKARCIAKPETYSARKARREAEIKGLKEALSILESQTAFVQRRQRMRGIHSAGMLQ